MLFPTIPDYKEALLHGTDTFTNYVNLEPVLDNFGDIYRIAGGFAVVFKMRDRHTKKLYALKCFHKKKNNLIESYALISRHLKTYHSPYLVNYKFLEKEIWVSNEVTDETEFPVVLMDWVEGSTLRDELKQAVADNNKSLLQHLSIQFDKLALWLLEQPFAHTDLKTENILVTPDKQLVLVDYDGLFVPDMEGQEAREEGTVGYKHPRRNEKHFNRHTDDFSILLMSLALRLTAQEPKLYTATKSDEHILFTEADLINYKNSKLFRDIWHRASQQNGSINLLVSILQMALDSDDGQIALLSPGIKNTMYVHHDRKVPKDEFTLVKKLTGHENTTGLYFSPDGKYLACAGEYGNVILYSVPDFKYLNALKDYDSEISHLAFSADSQFMVYGASSPVVSFLKLPERKRGFSLRFNNEFARFVGYSPDGNYVLSEGFDHALNLFSRYSNRLEYTFKSFAKWIGDVKFSPDGKWLAYCDSNNTIQLYDFINKKFVQAFVEDEQVSSIQFSPGSEWLASGGFEGTVNLYRLSTKQLMHTFTDYNKGLVALAFSPDGHLLAVGSESEMINIYDLRDNSLLTQLENCYDRIYSICFSPDGQYLTICDDDNINIYQVHKDPKPRTTARQLKVVLTPEHDSEWPLIEPGKSVGDIRLGDTMSSAINRLGNNYTIDKHVPYHIEYIYRNQGISLYINYNDKEGKIFMIKLIPPFKARTAADIQLGVSNLIDALTTYGEPGYAIRDAGLCFAHYKGIEFGVKEDEERSEYPFYEKSFLYKPILGIIVRE